METEPLNHKEWKEIWLGFQFLFDKIVLLKQVLKIILGLNFLGVSLALAENSPDASPKDTKKLVQNNFVETTQKGIKLSGDRKSTR